MLPLAIRRKQSRGKSPVEALFDSWLRDWGLGSPVPDGELTGIYPVDIREYDGKLIVSAELPGCQRDGVSVSVDKGILKIEAERNLDETKGIRHWTERRYTRLERCVSLPVPVNESAVQASLDDGILRLEFPVVKARRPERVSIDY